MRARMMGSRTLGCSFMRKGGPSRLATSGLQCKHLCGGFLEKGCLVRPSRCVSCATLHHPMKTEYLFPKKLNRRDFLAMSAGTAAATSLSGLHAEEAAPVKIGS